MEWEMLLIGNAIGIAFGCAGGVLITCLCAAERIREQREKMRKEVKKAKKEAKEKAEADYEEKLKTERKMFINRINEQKKIAELITSEEQKKKTSGGKLKMIWIVKGTNKQDGREQDLSKTMRE